MSEKKIREKKSVSFAMKNLPPRKPRNPANKMSPNEPREFENKFPEYDESQPLFDSETNRFVPDIEASIFTAINALVQTFESRMTSETDPNDLSVYTGQAGTALMYMKLAEAKALENKEEEPTFLKKAMDIVIAYLPNMKKKHYSFLCGVAGPLSVAAMVHLKSRLEPSAKELYLRMENLYEFVDVVTADFPDELLYGKSGFLYALMYLDELRPKTKIHDAVLKKIINSILTSGKHWANKFKNNTNFPLYYEWHKKAYVGAAHGFGGIFYMLLKAKEFISEEDLTNLVKPSIDLVLSLQFPSGNFPSSMGNSTDLLVHWCHGAPGIIHLMLLAYETFGDEKYLASAKECGELIWKKGLLKKGYGLCHGTAGNGYAFLRLFQVTNEKVHLYRALKFAEWCFDYGKHGCREADRPYSLFEGLAGTIYFLCDILDPMNAAFPGLNLPLK